MKDVILSDKCTFNSLTICNCCFECKEYFEELLDDEEE